MKASLATSLELIESTSQVEAIESALARHIQRSFATAHQKISGQSGNYTDSGGIIVSDHTLTINTGGQTLYVPCKIVVGDAPTT